jgi:hypothetical protein
MKNLSHDSWPRPRYILSTCEVMHEWHEETFGCIRDKYVILLGISWTSWLVETDTSMQMGGMRRMDEAF